MINNYLSRTPPPVSHVLLHLPQEHVVHACHGLALAGQVLSVHLNMKDLILDGAEIRVWLQIEKKERVAT